LQGDDLTAEIAEVCAVDAEFFILSFSRILKNLIRREKKS
jgi:hypothetical protein